VSKAEKVVQEIKAAGGDAIAVGGDVSADEFPDVIVKAAVEYVYRPWIFLG
jgi:3-oxoacyl-[acyl-carrier protein] reductase